MFYKKDYQRFGESLATSEEILYAIEHVSNQKFKRVDNEFVENYAYQIWENGDDQLLKILAALPINDVEEGKEIFWGTQRKFAEFDGQMWILTKPVYGVFNKIYEDFVTLDGGDAKPENVKVFLSQEAAQEAINNLNCLSGVLKNNYEIRPLLNLKSLKSINK